MRDRIPRDMAGGGGLSEDLTTSASIKTRGGAVSRLQHAALPLVAPFQLTDRGSLEAVDSCCPPLSSTLCCRGLDRERRRAGPVPSGAGGAPQRLR